MYQVHYEVKNPYGLTNMVAGCKMVGPLEMLSPKTFDLWLNSAYTILDPINTKPTPQIKMDDRKKTSGPLTGRFFTQSFLSEVKTGNSNHRYKFSNQLIKSCTNFFLAISFFRLV